jgi:hypothetical protein
MDERQKTSFAMSARTKLALESLKLRLRRAGLARSVASEASILEDLILNADFVGILERLGD